MNLILANNVQILSEGNYSDNPFWAGDSNGIYFNQLENNRLDLHYININNSSIKKIYNDCYLLDVDPKNDKLMVALTSKNNDSSSFAVLDRDGNLVTMIPLSAYATRRPIFAPDGNKILSIQYDYMTLYNKINIYETNNKSKNFMLLNNTSTSLDWSVKNQLLYRGENNLLFFDLNNNHYNLYSYDFNNGLYRQITHFKNTPPSNFEYDAINAVWSPDGELIVSEIKTTGSAQTKLAIINNKGIILKIFSNENKDIDYIHPVWSPDGKKIAFIIAESVEGQDYPKYSLGLIELDPSLQSGPRPDKIPEIKLVTFNVYLYGGIAIGILLLAITGFIFIRRKK